MPSNGTTNGRFELPQFTPLNFSLTDGTDIPPPPDSPIREEPEPEPILGSTIRKVAEEPITPATSSSANGHANGNLEVTNSREGGRDGRPLNNTSQTNISTDGRPPMSPVSVNRPSSIRRFLSRKSLNANYENGTNTNTSHENLAAAIERPESSMSFAMGGRSDKKRPSWFKRFSSKNKAEKGATAGKGNRASVIYENMKPQVTAPVSRPIVKGPPAPKLPELNRMEAQMEDDQGSLGGGEMFKNIK